jgi:hypothetical protein
MLDAFQGVLDMLKSKERTLDLDFLAGLPRPFFHFVLLWTHKEQTRKDIESRTGRRTGPDGRVARLLSWSWGRLDWQNLL